MTIRTIPHAGVLEDLDTLPAYLAVDHGAAHPTTGRYSCAFCGVGDSGLVASEDASEVGWDSLGSGAVKVELSRRGVSEEFDGTLSEDGMVVIATSEPLVAAGGVLSVSMVGETGSGSSPRAVVLR